MSLKRILGTMLATRMAGRGRRRGGLGTAAMMGLGRRRRRPGMGGMGLAALGYMAYRAYQDHQSRSTAGTATGGAGTGRTGTADGAAGTGSGTQGGIMGMVQDAVDKISGAMQPEGQGGAATASGAGAASGAAAAPAEAEMQEEARAAEDLSDRKALLLIRAMITAAYADGSLSTEERERIMGEIAEAGGDAEDRAVMEREIANPKPLDELLTEVDDTETAEEFYLASRAAIDGDSEADRRYLAQLRERLGLSDDQVTEIEEMAAG